VSTQWVTCEHKGHRIKVGRDPLFEILQYSIVRTADGYVCLTGAEDSDETVGGKIRHLKQRIDGELLEADPWGEAEASG
jgi:hypothetical protein